MADEFKIWGLRGLNPEEIKWGIDIAARLRWENRKGYLEPYCEKKAIYDWDMEKFGIRHRGYVSLPADYVPKNPISPQFIQLYPTVEGFVFGGRLYERSPDLPGIYLLNDDSAVLFWESPDAKAATCVKTEQEYLRRINQTFDPYGICYLKLRCKASNFRRIPVPNDPQTWVLEVPQKFRYLFIPDTFSRKMHNTTGPALLVAPKDGASEDYYYVDGNRLDPPFGVEGKQSPQVKLMQLAS
jgi:hypothetical protein